MQVPAVLASSKHLVLGLAQNWDSIDMSGSAVDVDIRGYARLVSAFSNLVGDESAGVEEELEPGTPEWDGVWECWAAANMATMIIVQGAPPTVARLHYHTHCQTHVDLPRRGVAPVRHPKEYYLVQRTCSSPSPAVPRQKSKRSSLQVSTSRSVGGSGHSLP